VRLIAYDFDRMYNNKTILIIHHLNNYNLSQKFAQNFSSHAASQGYYTAVVGARGVDIPLKSHK
jgi:hypothetical protein